MLILLGACVEEEVVTPPKTLENSLGMRIALVPAGRFEMGSPPGEPGRRLNEGPRHEVHVLSGFRVVLETDAPS